MNQKDSLWYSRNAVWQLQNYRTEGGHSRMNDANSLAHTKWIKTGCPFGAIAGEGAALLYIVGAGYHTSQARLRAAGSKLQPAPRRTLPPIGGYTSAPDASPWIFVDVTGQDGPPVLQDGEGRCGYWTRTLEKLREYERYLPAPQLRTRRCVSPAGGASRKPGPPAAAFRKIHGFLGFSIEFASIIEYNTRDTVISR